MDDYQNQARMALLTYPQASEILGITERTLWTLVKAGKLKAVRFGRSVRIDPSDLEQFIEDAKHEGGVRCE